MRMGPDMREWESRRRPNHSLNEQRPMTKLTNGLMRRLNDRLNVINSIDASNELDGLFEITSSVGRFDSLKEFKNHLREGALLDVSVIASKALSIPQGEYAVWATNSGTTILVPTSAPKPGDVVTRENPQYDLHTSQLLGSWNRITRTITERTADDEESGNGNLERDKGSDHFDTPPTYRPEGPYTFGSKIKRTNLWQAMKDRGMGDTELADAVGVDKSTISRLLRKVNKGKDEPGGRNPSVELAMKISKVLGVPIDMVMPPESELIGNKRLGTSGSGKRGTMGHSRNGDKAIGSGDSNESRP